ncbi:hypothetical protein LCGC14_2135880 [marine sediment metagenome]|uniref:PD-(D/E)XK endonuclease-like domain-containing protein n=1 Tax=marine sediment metagenome TaxID=412755 RepID=A0A0F9E004_9ZZZZ
MSEGLATYLSNPCEEGLEKALGAAKAVLVDRCPPDSEEWSLQGLSTLVERGITAAAETTLAEMLKTERVVGTEVSIGSGRIDLVTAPIPPVPGPFRDTLGHDYLIITDHKTSIQKAPRYIESDFKDIPLNWQLWDYAWRAQSYYGRPVRWIRIHQIILSPRTKCIMSEPSRINPENLEAWAKNAQLYWNEMSTDALFTFQQLTQNWHHCLNKYGPCRAYQACHSFLRDEKQMESVYVRKEKR